MYDIDLFYIASGESKSGKIWGKTILIFVVFTFQNCRRVAAGRSSSRMTVALLGSRLEFALCAHLAEGADQALSWGAMCFI